MCQKLEDMNTISLDMSRATDDVTGGLLRSVGVTYFTLPHCDEPGHDLFEEYRWDENENEESGQQGCKSVLEAHLLPWEIKGRKMGLFDIRNRKLPTIDAHGYRSNGFSDLAIGDHISMSVPANVDLMVNFALCLVELKTAKARLKNNELLLIIPKVKSPKVTSISG